MKKILAVFDADEEYGRRLSEHLNRKESVPFSMVFFTNEPALLQYGRQHPIDMLLLPEASMSDEIRRLGISRIVYLTEVQEYVMRPDEHFVYKFQPSDHVIRELMSCYETMDFQLMQTLAALRPVNVTGIYSPLSRCLKTSFALTLGQILSKEQMVLYLNFEEFSGLEVLFDKVFKSDLSDAVFYFSQGQLKTQLQELVESWQNLDYLPPVRYPEDLFGMDGKVLASMIQEIASVCHYDVILLDFGNSMRFFQDLAPLCRKLYMPVLDHPLAAGKLESFETWMKMKNQTETLGKITRLKLPYHASIGTGKTYLEQLLWGELGDYVRALIKGEW